MQVQMRNLWATSWKSTSQPMTFSADAKNSAAASAATQAKQAAGRLSAAVSDVKSVLAEMNGPRAASPVVWSRESLGLFTNTTVINPVVGTYSVVRSTEQVNNSSRVSLFAESPLWKGSSSAMPAVSGTFNGARDDVLTFTASNSKAATLRSSAEVNTASSAAASTTVSGWSGTSTTSRALSGTYTGTTNDRWTFSASNATKASLVSGAQVNATSWSASATAGAWSNGSTASRTVSGTYTGTTNETYRVTVGASTTASLASSATVSTNTIAATETLAKNWVDSGGKKLDKAVLPTIKGSYTGAVDDTYTVTVVADATKKSAELVDITNSAGTVLVNDLELTDKASATINGVTLSFGADSSLAAGDRITLSLQSAVSGLQVNNAMNGSGRSGANFDSKVSVSSGSFTVNGTSIAVSASDSVQQVLDRITASAAGVTASYDSGTGKVSLLSKTAGSGGAVTLGSDSSGFLNAVKLASPVATAGSETLTVTNSAGATVKSWTNTAGLTTAIEKGLSVSFGSGTLVSGGSFDISAIAAGSGAINADTAFNANPGFESGVSVAAGNLTINGVSIAVAATDTVNTALAKITNSAAGVTAAYDSVTEKVTLTAKTTGSGGSITLGPDTSGLLAALKLTAANSAVATGGTEQITVTNQAGQTVKSWTNTAGATTSIADGVSVSFGAGTLNAGESFTADLVAAAGKVTLDATKAFNGTGIDSANLEAGRTVTDGSFTVNGTTIAVHASDSLDDVLARINGSSAGVTASFDAADDTVTLTSTTGGSAGSITVGNDTSGLLDALKLANGTATAGSEDITVTDSSGATVAAFTNTAGATSALIDGLSVSFGAGSIASGDSFDVAVYAAGPITFDPTKAFNATGPASARLEDGRTITDGSFTVNGTTIAVYASDSLDDVLARINGSAADVDATYDADTEQVVLTNRTVGSAPVTLAGDTSGLLAALKLDGAVSSVGTDPVAGSNTTVVDAEQAMGTLGRFASVQAGTLVINGVEVAFDPSTDSVADVIARVNEAATGVTAVLSSDHQSVQLRGARGAGLTLADGGSGLLDALAITDRSLDPGARSGATMTANRRRELAHRLAAARSELSSIYNLGNTEGLSGIRSMMTDAVSGLSAGDQKLLNNVLGVSVSGASLAFDSRTVSQVARALDAEAMSSLQRTGEARASTPTAGQQNITNTLASLSTAVAAASGRVVARTRTGLPAAPPPSGRAVTKIYQVSK